MNSQKISSHKIWTKEEREEIIDTHVSREVDIFNKCFRRLNNKPEEPNKRIYLECFLLHTRSLFDFLCTKKKQDDDVSVADFLVDSIQLEKNIPIKKINKQLSHITYSRLKPLELHKKKKLIYKTIHKALEEYNTMVPEYYQVKHVKKII